ncbi:3'(2'),5'-bisphosphate nucleotidase [Buchnera aphidicola (Rhopalosiphum padi)]|jgi:3'(2'), 5'-bisphosphate nucleotidase|uniref:3'(2'),5'-bisphosphate nucleotidase CysQ n=1 Tax=Buchnera aphidicola subsp. Rhopalosiphum padi TaxID=98793 RepID=A0A4D6Y7D1_BUCRP|nr:3'(2'),5'-bisphosphate nucleotidase CysQ [Buchnera aphidicola]QCI25179.1 3'(2'),5'-bisphosphate nucleotidase [Buchnera aphidicola (Rhopalosiphum padi)]
MLEKICELAQIAGSAIMNCYLSKKSVNIFYKSDNTPITNADYEANNLIKKGLLSIFPKIPVLSEEGSHNFKDHKNWDTYWLVDPLDGTKEFLKKNGEFTVNISLIKKGIPVLGVIYAPFFKILYSSFNNEAWKENKKKGYKKKIFVTQSKKPLLVTSRSHPDKELDNFLNQTNNSYKIKKLGSSLKFCYIAEGKAQIYPRFGNTFIWDTAAGHAIITAAGGKIKTWNGGELNYSLSSSYNRSCLINPGFLASS